jgi:hypothetical protein
MLRVCELEHKLWAALFPAGCTGFADGFRTLVEAYNLQVGHSRILLTVAHCTRMYPVITCR